jgi:hypothetical protein
MRYRHEGHYGRVHKPSCGHEAVRFGEHVEYLVGGLLHHPHGDRGDDDGPPDMNDRKGRFDGFATPSTDDRYLREAVPCVVLGPLKSRII